jgi:hypothetical protein
MAGSAFSYEEIVVRLARYQDELNEGAISGPRLSIETCVANGF